MGDTHAAFMRMTRAQIRAVGLSVDHGTIYEDYPFHDHDFNEAFLIVSGSAVHVLEGREFSLSRGDFFAIKGTAFHGFRNVRNLEIINLMYAPEFFHQPHSEIRAIPGFDPLFLVEPELRLLQDYAPVLRLDDASLSYVVSMTDFILQQQKKNEPALYPVLRLNFTALASYLATQYSASVENATQVTMLSQAISYMERHLSDSVTLTDIADCIYLSPRQVERLFLKYYRKSPMKYLQQLRMEHARSLLVHQKLSVSETAHQCGFSDASYFARVFRSFYGISPGEMRISISSQRK